MESVSKPFSARASLMPLFKCTNTKFVIQTSTVMMNSACIELAGLADVDALFCEHLKILLMETMTDKSTYKITMHQQFYRPKKQPICERLAKCSRHFLSLLLVLDHCIPSYLLSADLFASY